ncbi:MAG TPA: hypothetical protein RMH99_01565 [Sandaracinaceae bacterium LLY-WYZ-13_1]|nr:hypothetical protein [Sandaracinaceae bacterium LLY-WYZ-13_1]
MRGEWTVRRARPRRVRVIEIGGRRLDGERLDRRVGARRVERAVADGADEAEVAGAMARDLGRALEAVRAEHPYDRVRADGGLSSLSGFRAALKAAVDVPVTFGRGGPFAGEVGGRAFLSRRKRRGGVVLDVGQTGPKASSLRAGVSRRVRAPRDPELLPIERPEGEALPAEVRERAYRALVTQLGEVVAEVAWPPTDPALVIGLPATVDDDGIPGPSTFAGLAGRDVTGDLLDALAPRLPGAHPWLRQPGRLWVMNDAELTAAAVRPHRDETVLVLTLGFGPGAALVG